MYLRSTLSGAAGNGLGTTTIYLRAAAGNGLCNTAKFLGGSAGIGLGSFVVNLEPHTGARSSVRVCVLGPSFLAVFI
jgi:hypothetical protein